MSDTVKLIIELPTDKYLSVKTNMINDFIYDAVKHGIPLDEMTNGEVIISLYPDFKYTIRNGRIITTIGVSSGFDLEWWSALYKAESEVKPNDRKRI